VRCEWVPEGVQAEVCSRGCAVSWRWLVKAGVGGRASQIINASECSPENDRKSRVVWGEGLVRDRPWGWGSDWREEPGGGVSR